MKIPCRILAMLCVVQAYFTLGSAASASQLEPRSQMYESFRTAAIQWQHWSPDIFIQAQKQQKLVYVVLGQSHCRSCEVFQRQVLMNEQVQAVLGSSFINVAVDVHESPELLAALEPAVNPLVPTVTWPLSLVFTPQKMLVMAGSETSGEATLSALVRAIETYKNATEPETLALLQQNSEPLSPFIPFKKATQFDVGFFNEYVEAYVKAANSTHGGLGTAPKRLQVMHHLAVNRLTHRNPQLLPLRTHSQRTLQLILGLGLYDHVEGGFFAYTLDDQWFSPNLSKNLQDNALALWMLLEAGQLSNSKALDIAIEGTYEFIRDRLGSKEGGFYHSITDMDAKRSVGSYYLWSHSELVKILTPEEKALAEGLFSLSEKGNVYSYSVSEAQAGLGYRGVTNPNLPRLHLERPLSEIATPAARNLLTKLRGMRSTRDAPLKRRQVFTYETALAAAVLAKYSRHKGDADALKRSEQALNYITKELWPQAKRLNRLSYKGKAYGKAQLREYSAAVFAAIEIYMAGGEYKYLNLAKELSAQQTLLFAAELGSVLASTSQNEPIFKWPRVVTRDTNGPSGVSLAVYNARRMADLTLDPHYARQAKNLTIGLLPYWQRNILSAPTSIVAMDYFTDISKTVVVAGSVIERKNFMNSMSQHYLPNVVWVQASPPYPKDSALFSNLQGKIPVSAQGLAIHTCANGRCAPHVAGQDLSKALSVSRSNQTQLPAKTPGTILSP